MAKTKQNPPKDDADQSREFIKIAREIGADQDSKADDVIERLAKMKPDPRKSKD